MKESRETRWIFFGGVGRLPEKGVIHGVLDERKKTVEIPFDPEKVLWAETCSLPKRGPKQLHTPTGKFLAFPTELNAHATLGLA